MYKPCKNLGRIYIYTNFIAIYIYRRKEREREVLLDFIFKFAESSLLCKALFSVTIVATSFITSSLSCTTKVSRTLSIFLDRPPRTLLRSGESNNSLFTDNKDVDLTYLLISTDLKRCFF